MNYEIIYYDSRYDDQIYRILREIWGSNYKANGAYFRWRYIEKPDSDKTDIYLVVEGDKLIAFRGFNKTDWQIGEGQDIFKAIVATDIAILPEYRNQGIYQPLMKLAMRELREKGYQYLLNFSPSPITYISCLSMGWKCLGTIKSLQKEFVNAEPSVISGLKKVLRKTGLTKIIRETAGLRLRSSRKSEPTIKVLNHLKADSKIIRRNITLEQNPKPEAMAALTSKLRRSNKIALVRNEDYFRWRYNSPLSYYFFLYSQRNAELDGYLVAQTALNSPDAYMRYHLLELEAVNPDIQLELFKSLISVLGSGTVLYTWSDMLDQQTKEFAISMGFKEESSAGSISQYRSTLLVRSTEEKFGKLTFKDTNLLDIDNWDLKLIYSDYY